MPLEVATVISQLQASNPSGTDGYNTADDHLRLLKVVLKTSFPGINAAMTATAAELNFVVGVTSSIQTQLNAKEILANKNVANGYAGLDAAGKLADARVAVSNITQFQGNLALSATQITGGTMADARIAATNVTQHQAALALAGSQITSGTLPDARIQVTGVTQHQAALSIAGSQLTGSIPAGVVPAGAVTQYQGSLSLAATQITSGVFADARIQLSNVNQFAGTIKTRNFPAKGGTGFTLAAGSGPPSLGGSSDGDLFGYY